jgi:hypothetical protein
MSGEGLTMAKQSRAMTKSPLALSRSAYRAAQQALPERASPYSKKKFTQPQLFTILVLRAFFRTDYRGMTDILRDFSDLQEALELQSVPHYSTLALAEKRLLKKGLLTFSSTGYSTAAGEQAFFAVKTGPSSTRRV